MSPPFGNIKKEQRGHPNSTNENLGRWRREQRAKIGHNLVIVTMALLLITSVRLHELSESLVIMIHVEGECLHVMSKGESLDH